MKDKINEQEIECLSNKIDIINNKYINTMTIDEIKENLETKIKPEVEQYIKDIFRDIMCISEDFKYELKYHFDNDKFNIEIIISSDDVY